MSQQFRVPVALPDRWRWVLTAVWNSSLGDWLPILNFAFVDAYTHTAQAHIHTHNLLINKSDKYFLSFTYKITYMCIYVYEQVLILCMCIRKIILQKLAHFCSSTLSNYLLKFVNINSCIYSLSIHLFTNSSSDAVKALSVCAGGYRNSNDQGRHRIFSDGISLQVGDIKVTLDCS